MTRANDTNTGDDGPRPGYAFGDHDRCQACSFHPESLNDYCDKHRPKENKMKKAIIKQDEKEPVPVEVLATSIRAIAAGIKNLRQGPLGEKALLLLISDNCQKKNGRGYHVKHKVSPGTIKVVLDSIESLQSAYLRK